MTWLTPVTGAILAAAVIPPLILLYFLKLRRRRQSVASTLLWMKSVEDLRANAPFQRLRRSLLLFLQLIALILLAVSVMQPQIQLDRAGGGRSVLLIDNSASMAATDTPDGTTRLEEAKRLARERVEAMYAGGLFSGATGETMIVAFSDRALVMSSFSASKGQLLSAIDRIQQTHGETRIAEALKLARAYTTNVNPDQQGRPIAVPATLELYTDGRIDDQAGQVLRGEKAVYLPIGTPDARNVAITNISVERPYDRPAHVEVFAAMRNYVGESVTCDVQLSVNGTVRGIEEVVLPPATFDAEAQQTVPGQKNMLFRSFEQPRGAIIEVANLTPDDLAADNTVRLIVPPPKRLEIAIVEPKNILLQSAIEGLAYAERIELLTAKQFAARAQSGDLDQYDVIVLDNYAPPEGLMPPGRYLSIGATPPVEGLNDYGSGEVQVILGSKDEHPALRFVSLDRLVITRFRRIEPADDVQIIAEGSASPAIVAVSRGEMQVIHVTFDLLDSTWPLERSFPTFIFNAIETLGNAGEALASKTLRPGEAIVTRLPSSATDIGIRTPSGPERITSTNPAMTSWGPIRMAGVHEVTWTEPGAASERTRPFAVNLLSETEGIIATRPLIAFSQEPVRGAETARSRYTPLWPWAVGLCLTVLMVEWWVYHRKTYF